MIVNTITPPQEPHGVALNFTTLQRLYAFACCIGTPGHEVHELVDNVTVEPGKRDRYTAEDNLLCDKQPDFVHIEALVSCTVQCTETCCQHVGNGLFFACIHPGSEKNSYYSNDNTCCGYLCIKVNIVCFAIGRYKVSERQYPATYNSYGCKKH